jgi:hypothetical protein
MLATVSPTVQNLNETLSTLRFAERAKQIQQKAGFDVFDPVAFSAMPLSSIIITPSYTLTHASAHACTHTHTHTHTNPHTHKLDRPQHAKLIALKCLQT